MKKVTLFFQRHSIFDYGLLVCSAAAYVLAFLFSDTLWWMVFFYPLLFLLADKAVTQYSIFFWSFFLSLGHLFGVFVALYRMGISWYYMLALLLYDAFTCCLIFFLVRFCFFWIKDRFFLNFSVLVLYRLWITYLILFPFGRLEGYILMHPIIVLSQGIFLSIVQYYNLFILTLLFYMISALPAFYYHAWRVYKKKYYVFIIPLLLISFFLCLPRISKNYVEEQQVAIDPGKIAVLPLLFAKTHNISELFRFILEKIEKIVSIKDEVELIVLPEGAVDVPISQKLADDFFQEKIKTVTLILGATCWKKEKLYNSCFVKAGNLKTALYKKRHALPLTERPLFSWFPAAYHVKPSKNQHPLIKSKTFSFVPYICSEFFFNNSPDDNYTQQPILLLCNDIWFSGVASYMQKLMMQTVLFKVKNWYRPVVYISYSKSFLADQNGKISYLEQFVF